MPDIIVTIPAHNEAATIGQVIGGVRETMPDARIQVVCNACADDTAIVAQGCGAIIYDTPVGGLANAFRMEMEHISGNDIIVHIDADGQYDPAEIPLLVEWIYKGYDLVLGNRLNKKLKKKKVVRYILNKMGSMAYSFMLLRWIPDMTTGFRAFTPEVAKLPIISDYTYTQEQVWRAIKNGFKVKSVPITFYRRPIGDSRLVSSASSYLMRSFKDFRRFAL